MIELISSHTLLSTVQQKFNKMLEENKRIIFPRQYINNDTINETVYHIAIIKRKEESDNNETTRFANSYGMYVEHQIVDNDEWVLMEKEPYNYEESFWVYGYNPRYYRKNFLFIYQNFVKPFGKNKYNFLTVSVFKNKVIFEALDKTELVICKNNDDALRLHNLLDDFAKEDKLKYVMFCGNCSKNNRLFNVIQKLTNWTYKKIMRNTT